MNCSCHRLLSIVKASVSLTSSRGIVTAPGAVSALSDPCGPIRTMHLLPVALPMLAYEIIPAAGRIVIDAAAKVIVKWANDGA